MTRCVKRVVILAVGVAALVVAAAWPAFAQEDEGDVTQQPGAFELVGTFPTEAMPFYDGDARLIQRLSFGSPTHLLPERGMPAKPKAPPLVSHRARSAWVSYQTGDRTRGSLWFFVDESKGEGTGYDRLYVDRNADGVFDTDESVGLMADPPAGSRTGPYMEGECLVFEPFTFRVRPDEPPRSLVVRLTTDADGEAKTLYVAEYIRRADVTLGGTQCWVFLANQFPGNYDDMNATQVIEYGPGRVAPYAQYNLWSINGDVYRLPPSPRGETLSVEEYVGEKGTIAVEMDGAWKGITVKLIAVSGTTPFLMAGGRLLEESGEFAVPAGHYGPLWLIITKGAASCSADWSDAVRSEPGNLQVSEKGRARVVLAAAPEVVFTKPEKDQPVRPGENVDCEALFESPESGLRIRGVSVRSDAADAVRDSKRNEPQVTVRDAAGSVIAEGVMPFG